MEHAGFDRLHTPFGAMLVCIALLLITAVIMVGSVMVKAAMVREKAVRTAMREARDNQKNQ